LPKREMFLKDVGKDQPLMGGGDTLFPPPCPSLLQRRTATRGRKRGIINYLII